MSISKSGGVYEYLKVRGTLSQDSMSISKSEGRGTL